MRVRIIIDSDWSYERLNLRSTKYKHKYSLDLDCFETKRNVEDFDVYLINIPYYIINMDCKKGKHGELSLLENQCQLRLRLGRLWFSRGKNSPSLVQLDTRLSP